MKSRFRSRFGTDRRANASVVRRLTTLVLASGLLIAGCTGRTPPPEVPPAPLQGGLQLTPTPELVVDSP
ncbi:MAG: hypothetical protein ACI9OJ_001013 [Myxococcota bacterium]|jgi:hypothetical protein